MLQIKLLLNRYAELDNIEDYLFSEVILMRDLFYKSLSEDKDDKGSYFDPKYPSLKLKLK